MDFFKNRIRIAFWSALFVAGTETARQYALGDYREEGSVWIDFGAMLTCNWLIWQFNFFVDDYQQQLPHSPRRLFLFRAALVFTVGTAIVLIVESIVHHFFRENDNVWFYFLRGMFHNALILVIYYALQQQRRHRDVALENAQLREENTNAQLDLLRQQVNPHFLFNALNTLKSMVKSGDSKAVEFVVKLSETYRYLLQNNPLQQVTVREEMNLLRSYSFLMEQRFGEGFQLDADLPDEILDTSLPPLTFQLLVENAVKHNVISTAKPLYIRIACDNGKHIAVSNPLQPKLSTEEGAGIGLKNIKRRYQLLTGQSVRVEQEDGQFTVYLPIIFKFKKP